MRSFTVAIAGGGASGTLVASALTARSPHAHVVIIDPAEQLGRGVAYTTDCPRHLLNVPAAKMSAFSTDPEHFTRWLASNAADIYGPTSFVPRSLYGDYLSRIAIDAQAAAPNRWRHIRANAVDVRTEAGSLHVVCSDGTEVRADTLVVATGNASPAPWPNVSPAARGLEKYFESAWVRGATVPDSPNETVLLLGMGLTALDALLGLRHNGHRGTVYLVSRRGLLPNEHRVFDAPPAIVPEAKSISELLDAVRTLVRDQRPEHWRGIIDQVRPHTNALWQSFSLEEQRRFVRHALPYWNVHRHRIAPDAAREFNDLRASGTVRVIAGRTGEIAAAGERLRVSVTVRGSSEIRTIKADRVINCSGPQHDFRKLENPLVRKMLERGSMVPSPLGIGARVTETGALVGADHLASTRFFAIGPARFGTLIETTAIPEIREQARELADLLSRERFDIPAAAC